MQYAKITEELFLGPKPNAKDIAELKTKGITSILSCLEPREVTLTITETCRKEGLLWTQVPIPDAFYGKIPTCEQIFQAVDQLEAWLSSGQKVYLHCFEGRGRSPLIAMAYLTLKREKRIVEAIYQVKKAWPLTDPR